MMITTFSMPITTPTIGMCCRVALGEQVAR
jgi:hypothetical protein